MRGAPLQGPIGPAVPLPQRVLDGFSPVGNPGIDWQAVEIIAGSGEGLAVTVPPDLTQRRLYLYSFIFSDLTQQIQWTSSISFFFQNSLLGKIPLEFRNYTPSVISGGDKSSINFSLSNSAGVQQLNCIALDLVGVFAAGIPANYGPSETSPALLAPYEFNLRCDRIEIARFAATGTAFHNRLFLGVLSLKP